MTETERKLKAKIPGTDTGIEIRRGVCDICSPTMHCGIDAYVKDGKIIKVEGTREHPLNRGALCTKGAANRQYVYREDRIKTPLRRIGTRGEGKFEPIGWEEAFAEIKEKLNKIKAEDGPEAVAFASGYSKWYRPIFKRFAYSFGSPNYGTESSVCFEATVMAWKATTGVFSVPDVERSKVFLGWALNPHYSDHLTARNVQGFKENGGKVIIVDTRVTPAVDKFADIHLQIKPGTDGALALGMARLIIDNGWEDKEFIEKHTYGYEDYKAEIMKWDLGKVSEITGLEEQDILEATRLFATGGPSSIQQSAAPITHHCNGFQNYRAIIALSAITGNYDCGGGCIPMPGTYVMQCAGFPTREAEFAAEVRPGNVKPVIGHGSFPVWDAFIDEFQMVDLSRQILEGAPYPVKAIFALGVNAKMFPDTRRFYKALDKLDFFVDSELFMTDTAKYADLVLPACTSLERGEYKCYPGGFSAFTKPVIAPLYESKSDVDMLCELANYMELDDELLRSGYEKCIDWIIQDTGLTVEALKENDLPVMTPAARPPLVGDMRENGFPTPTKRFEFKSSVMEKLPYNPAASAIPTYIDPFEGEEKYPFTLTSGARLPFALHSRLHEVPWLRSLRPRPQADISLRDAERLDIREGELVELFNTAGAIRVAAFPTARLQPGNIHIYHGYREANANDLVDTAHVDPCTGFPGYNSVGCNIKKL